MAMVGDHNITLTKRVPSPDNCADGYTKSLTTSDWGNIGMKSKGYGAIYPYGGNARM